MEKINGKIIVNPFKCPGQSIKQAERLKEEFEKLKVEVEIVCDGYNRLSLDGENLSLSFANADFVIFLDKDKYLALAIEKFNIRMFNQANQIFDCDDKGQTCIKLSNLGVKMPKTLFAPVCYLQNNKLLPDFINRVEDYIGYPVIIKKAYGSMGNGVFKADNKEELVFLMESIKTQPHIFQEYLGKNYGTDIRVIVLGKKAVALMKRVNQNDFRSNIGQGGYGEKIDLNDEYYKPYIECAEKVARLLNMDYCGVDLLADNDNNPTVCEVNSNAFFEGIESVTKVNIAKLYAQFVIENIK